MKSALALALSLLALAFAMPVAAQMAIDDLIITSGPAYANGSFTDFFIDPVVFGSEIAAVSVTIQSGTTIDFVEVDDDEFACDGAIPSEPCENFTSLAEINAIGNLTFDFLGENGETDSVFVPAADYAPGSGQSGVPTILSPAVGDDTLPPSGLFEWVDPPSWVDLVVVDLVDLVTDSGVDEAFFFDHTTTSWSPMAGSVLPGRSYVFELSFVDLFFQEDDRTTSGGRDFLFSSGFQAFNGKFVPEPTGAAVWLPTAAWLAWLRRRASSKRQA